MSILERRTGGAETKAFTVRVDLDTYHRLYAYAYSSKIHLSLAVESLIEKSLVNEGYGKGSTKHA